MDHLQEADVPAENTHLTFSQSSAIMPSKLACSLSKEASSATDFPAIPPRIHIYPTPSSNMEPGNMFLPPTAGCPACTSQPLSLQELVDNYSQRFPMQIKVINGFSGQTTQLTLSSGDYYNIHFMKHQEVISLKDKIGFTYTIPLNSSLCFGLVHSGRANQLRDLDTHVYKRVSDLLALSPLPKVVCATKDVKGSDEKCIVTADEILVIRNVLKPKLRKRSLEVLSLKTQTTKILPSDCEGHFTLSPKRNQIYLLELVKCIPDPFPCQAMMFVTDKLSSKLQCITPTLLSTVFTVTGHKTETSLIASAVTRAENGTKDAGRAHIQETLVDIPVDERLADVEVAIIETKNSQQENLNDTTRALFENFDATRVTSWYDGSSDNVHITQHLLYSSIKRDSKGPSIHVDKPLGAYSKESPSLTFNETHTNVGRESLYESLSFTSETDSQCCSPLLFQPFTSMPLESKVPDQKFSSHNSQSPSHNFDHFSCDRAEALYELPISRKNLMEPPTVVNLKRSHSHPASFTNLEPDYEDMQSVKKQYASIKLSLNSGRQEEFQVENTSTTALIDSLKASIADLATQVSGIEHQVREIVQISTVIQKNVSILTTQISKLQGSTAQCAPDIVVENEAQHYLQQLDTHQVEQLLEAMGLSQYTETFRCEQVTGKLLLQCTEEMLEEDLGVGNRLHRKRLMSVICGQESIRNLMQNCN